jgi:predicted ATPase
MAALADVRDESGLVAALERALTVSRGGGWPAIENALQDPSGVRLLVLDNAEQAIGIVATAVQRLLAVSPILCLVVTSRHALEVDGELLVDVPPLVESQDTALAMFIDRARAVRADFHASRENQAALTELIAELDGLPLALELAAARVRSFSPAQMLAQWRDMRVAAGTLPHWLASPTRAPRHASIIGLVDWSLRLLGPEPRTLLQRLACLPGAFSWADVAALEGTPASLGELTNHCLIQTGDDAEPRYRLLELLRRGVLAHVDPQEQRATRRQMREALCQWAAQLGLQAPITDWRPRRDLACALIASAVEDGDAVSGLRLALAMRPCWESDGVGRSLVVQLGDLLQATPPSSEGHELRAHLAFTHGDRALAIAEAELALQIAGSDPAARAPALVRRAWVLLAGDNREQGQTRPLEEAVSLARRVGDVPTEARAWQQLAAIAVSRGQHAQAEALYARAQDLWEAVGHARQAAARLRNRAQCLIQLGDVATAVAWITACARLAEAEGDGVGQFDAAYTLALAHEAQRNWPAALAASREALRIAHARQHLHARALALQLFARPLARLRQPESALKVAAFAEAYWLRHLGKLGARESRNLSRARRLAAVQLERGRALTAWSSGQTLALADILTLTGV